MKMSTTIRRLRLIAEALGYTVVFRRIQAMQKGEIGLTCPDVARIYIDPKAKDDIASTLAHEIAHVMLLAARTPGHRSEFDTEFDLRVAENAADEIGKALCRALGHTPDFQELSDKGLARLAEAKRLFGDSSLYRSFANGYCYAMADALPTSEAGLKKLLDKLAETADAAATKAKRTRFTHGGRTRGRVRR